MTNRTEDSVLVNGQDEARAALRAFKRAYETARDRGNEQFQHDGQTVLVSYARYLIELAERVADALDEARAI